MQNGCKIHDYDLVIMLDLADGSFSFTLKLSKVIITFISFVRLTCS